MTSKKDSKASNINGLTALKIGSRVRCTDDGVQGRITWANAVAVKVQWDDGEQVTWRRDALASRPIEILTPADAEREVVTNPEPVPVEQSVWTEVGDPEPSFASPSAKEPTTTEAEQSAAGAAVSVMEPAATELASAVAETTQGPAASTSPDTAAEMPVSPPQQERTAVAPSKQKKLSALDAAAKVLAESGQAMSCQELIAAMAQKGYWSSPGGQTPAATLYSALLRELQTKGPQARFVKSQRGKFALRSGV